ncbi:hypothetical protein [Flagellimonas abyssi]|uniref:Uncharacterized protein n=1 Tax=Flagellimonas abyssi TaxID=2864871 RepID=A0ABS7EQA3_9FLAO|nr:hypothetical protein [Allomuricauda abyssi]MBW8199754.1 hypothetical protein [Allomuricauda abyssi]
MLDKNTGTLSIDEGIKFGPKTDFNIIKDFMLGENPEVIGTSDAQEQKIIFRNVAIDGRYFILRLSFSYNKLILLEIFINTVPFYFKENWNNWSYEDEMEHLEYCKNWLQREVGTKRNFDWGSIWCGYDSLGGFSSIKINYSRQ